jgi:purine-binding chemotaxis protein CheW
LQHCNVIYQEASKMDLRTLQEDPAVWQVLAERARALALQEEIAAGESGAAVLTFRLGGSSYCLPATAVREVQPLGLYARLPAVPPFVIGLVNVRGRLITALDLRPLLGIPAEAPAPGSLLLIAAVGGSEIGLMADSVVAVSRRANELSPAPSAAAGHGIAWVRGVDEDLCLHLDPELLFAAPTLVVNTEAEA